MFVEARAGRSAPNLPGRLTQNWLLRAARGAGVTPANVAVPLLAIASGVIGTGRRVQASRSWSEPLPLWSAVVGFSGSGKTPGINVTKRALSFVERQEKSKVEADAKAHKERAANAKAARKAWENELKRLAEEPVVQLDGFREKKATPPMPAEAVDPGPFVAPRLFVSDATVEKIAVLLQARPRGMLLIADELSGLFLNMGRYNNGSDVEFWLEAWNGCPYTVERLSREPVSLDHLLVGMVGGFQPDKLSLAFKTDDGMYARMLFAWPEEPLYRPLTDDVAELEPEIINAVTRLNRLDAGENEKDGGFAPRPVLLSREARQLFEDFRKQVHEARQTLEGREREWWAKSEAQVLRLAGTLSFFEWAWVGGGEPQEIGATALQSAVQLIREYFWPHSKAALRQIGLNDRHAHKRRVLRWIIANKRTEVALKDIRRDALGQKLDAEQTRALIGNLVKTGWLRESKEGKIGPGKPARRWAVNPTLFSRSVDAENAENAEIGPL